jgi:glutamine synthetase adenylyltransferase
MMTFSSDADLLFIHSEGSGSLIQSLAARVAGLLSPPGGPYPVDMRLRPEGRSAPTSVDTEYLESYLSERASPWEALALSRVRPLFGRKSMLDKTEEIIEEWLERFRLDPMARSHLRGIRQRQEEETLKEVEALSGADQAFDVKRSPGSMSDVEYLVLGLTLDRWRRPQPRPAHIPDLIPRLVEEGVLSSGEADQLGDIYMRLRQIQIGLQLHHGRDVTRLPGVWPPESSPVSIHGATADSIAEDTAWIRDLYEREFPV